MESLVLIFIYIFGMILSLGIILPIYKNHKKVTRGVVNYDPFMREFVYKVYMSREEIISSLKISNVKDPLSCTFDFEKNTVVFSEYGGSGEYFYEIREYDGFSILKLSQATLFTRGYISYKLNPFLVNKIDAEIVPFSQYGN